MKFAPTTITMIVIEVVTLPLNHYPSASEVESDKINVQLTSFELLHLKYFTHLIRIMLTC
jgi:hypothetical protein